MRWVCIAFFVACSPAERVRGVGTTVDLASYQLALDACRAEGRDAGSYSAYSACADRADVKFGRKKQ